MHYYNDSDPMCCLWLKALIAARLIPPGHVDGRSIKEIDPADLKEFTQCHFFAGIGGWPYALKLAGWPDDRPVFTGSAPCQPFSVAGSRRGTADPRHLWPDLFKLIRSCKPPTVMGEQVGRSAGYAWFDGVATDLEAEGYTCGAVDIPACGFNAPHIRNRLYWVADTGSAGLSCPKRQTLFGEGRREEGGTVAELGGGVGGMDDAERSERGALSAARIDVDHRPNVGRQEASGDLGLSSEDDRWVEHADRDQQGDGSIQRGRELSGTGSDPGANSSFWDDYELIGPDDKGKYRRVKPGILLLAHGIPGRMAQMRGMGNSIVPVEAAQVIAAYMDCHPYS